MVANTAAKGHSCTQIEELAQPEHHKALVPDTSQSHPTKYHIEGLGPKTQPCRGGRAPTGYLTHNLMLIVIALLVIPSLILPCAQCSQATMGPAVCHKQKPIFWKEICCYKPFFLASFSHLSTLSFCFGYTSYWGTLPSTSGELAGTLIFN